MSSQILAKCDYPRDKACAVAITDKLTFGELKTAIAKGLGIELKGYSYTVVAFGTLPRAIDHDDKALCCGSDNKSLQLKANQTLLLGAPAHLKPLIKRVKKEKEEKKSESGSSDKRAQAWKDFKPATILDKLLKFIEQKDTKKQKNAMEYCEAYAQEVLKSKTFASLPESVVVDLLKSDSLNCPELDIFKAALAWAKAECGRTKKDFSKTDDVKEVLKKIYPLIRYPNMQIGDVAGEVANSNLLDQSHLLALFSYIGLRSSSEKAKLPDELKEFSAKPRKGRAKLNAWKFVSKGYSITLSEDDKKAAGGTGNVKTNEWDSTDSEVVIHFRIDTCSYMGIAIVGEGCSPSMDSESIHSTYGCYLHYYTGTRYSNGSSVTSAGTFTSGDIVTFQVKDGSLKTYKNNTYYDTYTVPKKGCFGGYLSSSTMSIVENDKWVPNT
jgi:hypothetical protein